MVLRLCSRTWQMLQCLKASLFLCLRCFLHQYEPCAETVAEKLLTGGSWLHTCGCSYKRSTNFQFRSSVAETLLSSLKSAQGCKHHLRFIKAFHSDFITKLTLYQSCPLLVGVTVSSHTEMKLSVLLTATITRWSLH